MRYCEILKLRAKLPAYGLCDQSMMTTRQAREKKAAETFRSGKARRVYTLRKAILCGSTAPSGRTDAEERVCSGCRSLLDLKDVFDSFFHAGRSLRKRRAIYPKLSDVAYRDLSKQNEFLVKSVFDCKGNYLYHRNCIVKFSVSATSAFPGSGSLFRQKVAILWNWSANRRFMRVIVCLMSCFLMVMKNQLECISSHSPLMLQYHAESIPDTMEMLATH